jgi:hypothetical protein
VKLKRYLTFISENSSEIVLEYYCFDWDDNLLSMPTKINMEHKVGDKWVFNPVSTEHFAEIRSDKENWRPAQGAFIEFSDDGPRGDSAFLEDMMTAIGGAKSPQEPLKKAPSWNKFIQCLENGSLFSIITARAHKPETLRKGVEWIIDNYLSYEQKRNMYNNCLSFYYIFGGPGKFQPSYENISQHPLIAGWLDHCEYYGVSYKGFIEKHKSGGAESPEIGKEIALKEFISKAASFANQLGVKFKAGMSDDDMKNVMHMTSVLSELKQMYPEAEFTMIDTSKGGYQKTDIQQLNVQNESTHTTQAPGMASSVMSFTSFNNMASRLFPANTQDNDPVANTHRMATDYITKQSKEWTKNIRPRRKKKQKKQL